MTPPRHGLLPNRRRILKTLGAGAATTFAAPFIGSARAAETLFVNSWGGVWETSAAANLFAPFTKDTGVDIKTVTPVSIAKLAAQVKSGVYDFDVTTLGDADIVRANETGLLEPIDGAPFDRSPLWPEAIFQNGVASHAFATVIAYRTDKFPNGGPKSWTEFWDLKRFPGPRSLQRHAPRVLAIALMADGVAPDKLYPLDLDRAFASLDKIKPAIRVWWTQGPQSQQLLRDGEVDLMGIWHANPIQLKSEKLPVDLTWNQALIDRAYWVVAKGSPRAALGWKYIQSAVLPDRLAGFCKTGGTSSPLNPKSFDFLNAADAKDMPTNPENLKLAVFQDTLKASGQLQEASQRFERWIAR